MYMFIFTNEVGVSIATSVATEDITQILMVSIPHYSLYCFGHLLLPCFLFFSLFLCLAW